MFKEIAEKPSVRVIADYYNKIDGHYDALYNSPVCLAEDQVVVKKLKHHLSPNSKILDVGCGTGLIASYIDGYGVNFTGIDVSSEELKSAIQKMPHHKHDFFVADQQNMPVPSNTFDNLTSTFGPFSYSHTPEALKDELMRPLKDGGNFLIMPYTKRTVMGIALGGSTAPIDGDISRIPYTEERICEIFGDNKNVEVAGVNYLTNLVMEEVEQSRQEFVIDEKFLMRELVYLTNRMGEVDFILPEYVNFGRLPEL